MNLFWNGILDRPFRLFGVEHVYLAPGSERGIEAHPDLGNVNEYILPGYLTARALERDEMVVYDARGPRLRNITTAYAARPRETKLPQRVDAASPLTSNLLGPEWYPSDGGHRWIARRATVRLGGPSAACQKLYLSGQLAKSASSVTRILSCLMPHPARRNRWLRKAPVRPPKQHRGPGS
jgi:hypothetical protein